MSDESEKTLAVMRSALDTERHLHMLSNAKSSVLLLVASLTANVAKSALDAAAGAPLARIGFGLMLVSLGVAILAVLVSVFPRMGNRDPKNLLYFPSIIHNYADPEQYEAAVRKQVTSDNALDVYSREVYDFGLTLSHEYRWQRVAWLALLGYVPAIALLLFQYVR